MESEVVDEIEAETGLCQSDGKPTETDARPSTGEID